MSYQVLARKWRPAKFADLVGQDHVKSALINGLSHQRLHHAYLFTGTRGVGKTSIARIFAKSLNCEVGVSAEPCGQCPTCVDVDAGRFVDLIEIDAASRTKVGDTREILDNVQYAPTRGRYKIYLIDEVHMLSRHSFNALLKTLEEPPEHVKFLLATTDPQKLPVTILSRCLQFNLQALGAEQIEQQLQMILQQEAIPYQEAALKLLAKFAKGSMRDGLSLTDQAVAQSGQNVTLDAVQSMLGTVDVSWSQNILAAVINNDSQSLVDVFASLNKQNPDSAKVLDDLLTLCHQVAMTQVLPAAAQLGEGQSDFIKQVAETVSPQEVQVYYQLLLQGKSELALAADPASGFEMICLRLLAFVPAENFDANVKKNTESSQRQLIQAVSAPEASSQAVNETQAKAVSAPAQPIEDAESDKRPEQHQPEENAERVVGTEFQPSVEEALEPLDDENQNQPVATSTQVDATEDVAVEGQVHLEDSAQDQPPAYFAQEMSDADLEALNNQQAFYQDLAESQGFSHDIPMTEAPMPQTMDSVYSEPSESPVANEPDVTASDDPMLNPVLAILASRGIDAENATIPSPVEPQETVQEVEEEVVEEAEAPLPELKTLDDEEVRFAHEVDQWAQLIEQSDLAGLGRQLALNGAVTMADGHIELTVKQEFAHLLNEKSEAELIDVVSRLAPESQFTINKSELTQAAPSDIQKNINQNRQQRAEESIHGDAFVQILHQDFDAQVIPDSIKPL